MTNRALLPLLILLAVTGLIGCPGEEKVAPPTTETWPGRIVSLNIGEAGWVLTQYGLYDPDRNPVALPPSEVGHRLTTAWVDPDGTLWLGYEVGRVYRSPDGGHSWEVLLDGYVVPDFLLIDLALRRPIPRQFVRTRGGDLYLATVGRGLVRFDEVNEQWVDGTWAMGIEGEAHPLTWSAGRQGDAVVAGFVDPLGLVPPQYEMLFGDLVRRLDGPDAEAEQIAVDSHVKLVADLGERDGRLVMASLGRGVFERIGDEWVALGPTPEPADLIAMDIDPAGQIGVVTLTGDVWVLRGEQWDRVRCGSTDGPRGADLRWDGGRLQVAVGDTIESFHPETVECAERGGATVLLAFSQHTSLFHSYRGDTNDDDGFGKDIEIIRSTIEIFDRHPQFCNDWDPDNLFSLDGWILEYAPDILDDIRRRVEDGQDGVRLMSWNNGLMTNETLDEFTASVERAKDSLEAFVPGLWTPGVQPQENTLTPAHVAMYPALGIEWITLFYSATSFTGFRHEVALSMAEAHGVLTLESPLYPNASMKLVPVYHHADMLEHGGLANWLRQLHQNLTGTVALVIHFDADGDTWLGFESELEAVEELDADWVVPARLQDIVAQLAPVSTVTLHRDLADGNFDGLSSWTEKPVNHRFYTRIVRSRLAERWALELAPTVDATMQQALDDAFEARLYSLSTTHFGLANPRLHPDREATGDASTIEAETRATDALAQVLDASTLPPLSARNLSGSEVAFLQPIAGSFAGTGGELRTLHSFDGSRAWLAGSLALGQTAALTLGDASLVDDPVPLGGWGPDLVDATPLGPMIRLAGVEYRAELGDEQRVTGNGGEVITILGDWQPGHGGTGGSVRYDWIRFDADPDAWWVEVTVTFPTFGDEDVVLWWDDALPLELQLGAAGSWTVERPLITGEVARYTVAEAFDALNSHAADGWVNLLPDGAEAGLSITTFQPLRAAPGFLPLRSRAVGDTAYRLSAAPFSALWGELLDHRPQSTLGAGLAELTSRLTGSQFHPTAPAWEGVTTCFLLRIQPGTNTADHPQLSAASQGVLVIDADGRPAAGRPHCW
ncbi:MAG: hypothetical protein ABI333_29610 [bacterium]